MSPSALVCPNHHAVAPGSRFCTVCGAQLVEVRVDDEVAADEEDGSLCAGCGAQLVSSALVCPRCGTPCYVYWRTEGWTNTMRGEFTTELLDAGVPHSWHGQLLLVDYRYEGSVDRMLDERFEPEA